jgi:hypothetical protein
MNLFKENQRLRERLVTNAVERYLLTEFDRNPFADPNIPTSVRMISEDLKMSQEEIITVFRDYKIYGMQMLRSDGMHFIRITH